ncbi:HAD family hydrolase [Salisaeta longa]|uniref:HAD family hydrolase n=1 Tax=Salisaeta longa TaxID=503170 RepID=UPI0003B5C730|nr:HAD family phosphatase [Salisaeta longa]
MIDAFVFDLDGTLVQTERLKARSYAQAAEELCPNGLSEDAVLNAYRDVVGRSREHVATTLMERFDLTDAAHEYMEAQDGEAHAPWQAFVNVRLGYYNAMMRNPDTIRDHRWTHTIGLLQAARSNQCAVALATTSRRDQTERVLEALGLADAFDCIATADDVQATKPHPEIYRLVAVTLGIRPDHLLAIEDSPAGVQAARTAGLHCIAVATDFTRNALYDADLLPSDRIVDDPNTLPTAVQSLLDTQSSDA